MRWIITVLIFILNLNSGLPQITPVFTGNLLHNASFTIDDLGIIRNWAQTEIELQRWYGVQENREYRWFERVALPDQNEEFVLQSIDGQTCDAWCSTSAVQIVPAQASTIYILIGYAKVLHGDNTTIYLDFLDANRQRIKAIRTQNKAGDEWVQHGIIAFAPPQTHYIRVILYSSNQAQSVVYWDTIRLYRINMP